MDWPRQRGSLKWMKLLAHQFPTLLGQSWPATRLLPIATAANEMGWTEMAPAKKGGVTATRERVRNTHKAQWIQRDKERPNSTPSPFPGTRGEGGTSWEVRSCDSSEAIADRNLTCSGHSAAVCANRFLCCLAAALIGCLVRAIPKLLSVLPNLHSYVQFISNKIADTKNEAASKCQAASNGEACLEFRFLLPADIRHDITDRTEAPFSPKRLFWLKHLRLGPTIGNYRKAGTIRARRRDGTSRRFRCCTSPSSWHN